MDVAALIVSITALMATVVVSLRHLTLARHANTLPAVVGLFQEHRGAELARARHIVVNELADRDLSEGLGAVPEEHRQLVLDLCWFYDNIGALVAHGVVPLAPVSGYLGGSVVETWKIVRPMALAEREKRRRLGFRDPERWQAYYENLYRLVLMAPPEEARTDAAEWYHPQARRGLRRPGRSRSEPTAP
ncbi:hypothetical protein ABZZ47_30405 [Streptomyces sp. NPDC006465]|uniref:DUF4760 domain-containing protein n=1 Tax=Streptomyces sp. NPDC006465 TaxID=3157174 RepID=UPI0033BE5D16